MDKVNVYKPVKLYLYYYPCMYCEEKCICVGYNNCDIWITEMPEAGKGLGWVCPCCGGYLRGVIFGDIILCA